LVRKARFSGTIWRAKPKISAQVNSAGGSERLAVPQTTTPWAWAAATSIEAFRIPEVINSLRFGNWASKSALNGVRSRIITTISQSWIA